MSKTAEQAHNQSPKPPQQTSKDNTLKSPKIPTDAALNIWPRDPEHVVSNFYQAWSDITRSFLPTIPDAGNNGNTTKPSGDAFGMTTWQEQADRYFKDFNQKWLDIGKMSTFNVLAPMNPMAMGAGVTISDEDEKFTVSAPLPGLNEDQVNVQLDDGFLIIFGENTGSSDEKSSDTQIHAWQSGNFRYLVRLPANGIAEKIKADFSKGVLTVTMPKTTQTQEQPRTVKVNK